MWLWWVTILLASWADGFSQREFKSGALLWFWNRLWLCCSGCSCSSKTKHWMRQSASCQCGRHAHGTKLAWTFQNNWFSATDEFFPGNIYIAYVVLYHIDYIVYGMIFKLGVKHGAQVPVGLLSLDVFTVNVLSEWTVLLFLKSIRTSLNWENFHHTTWHRQAEHRHSVTLPPCRRDRCAGSSENGIRELFSLRDLQHAWSATLKVTAAR